jgi:hypothetical protein
VQKINNYLLGAALGVLIAVIVGFSAHLVVTKSSMEKKVTQSRVDLLADICLVDAQKYLKTQDPAPDLTGWAQNDNRTKLAQQYAPVLPGENAPENDVVKRCADDIQDAQMKHG